MTKKPTTIAMGMVCPPLLAIHPKLSRSTNLCKDYFPLKPIKLLTINHTVMKTSLLVLCALLINICAFAQGNMPQIQSAKTLISPDNFSQTDSSQSLGQNRKVTIEVHLDDVNQLKNLHVKLKNPNTGLAIKNGIHAKTDLKTWKKGNSSEVIVYIDMGLVNVDSGIRYEIQAENSNGQMGNPFVEP